MLRFIPVSLCVSAPLWWRSDRRDQTVEQIAAVHKKQLLTYLRLSDKRLGLLINFGETLIEDGISRVANGLEE